jgi:thiol:disulfide interchange protein
MVENISFMPSLKRVHIVAAFVLLGVAAFLYSVIISAQLLLGTGVAIASFVVVIFTYYGGTNRKTATRATIIVTLIYGVFTLQLPIAVIAACVVYLTAWLTGSDSPLDAPDRQVFPVESTATNESNDSE